KKPWRRPAPSPERAKRCAPISMVSGTSGEPGGSAVAVLIALIAVNVAMSIAGFRALGGGGGRAEHFQFIPNQVARGENGLGMLLAHFSHAGLMHLLLNMFTLFSFAGPVIVTLGPAKFLAIYIAAGLGSDLVVFALWKDDPTYRCLGASGSVFGIMMAAI